MIFTILGLNKSKIEYTLQGKTITIKNIDKINKVTFDYGSVKQYNHRNFYIQLHECDYVTFDRARALIKIRLYNKPDFKRDDYTRFDLLG